jgi:hypothetical protein
MAQLAPPPRVCIATGEDDRLQRVQFRLWQIFMAAATIFATCGVFLAGIPILSITAVAIAKHVLVAIYCMGLDVYPVQKGGESTTR